MINLYWLILYARNVMIFKMSVIFNRADLEDQDNMAKPNRNPMQVSPEFKKKLDDLQRKIMMSQGKKKSLREITTDIISSPIFNEIEKNLIKAGNIDIDFKIKLDRRFLE